MKALWVNLSACLTMLSNSDAHRVKNQARLPYPLVLLGAFNWRELKVDKIKTPDRPDSIALISALESAIDEISTGKMTPIEVLGCLDMVSKRFFDERLSIKDHYL